MRLHPNAKTTPRSRALLVRRVHRHRWSVADAAEALGISERTVYKWLRRHRLEGLAGLRDRSSAPRRIPHRTSTSREARIGDLRRRRKTAWEIARSLRMPPSTVSCVLRRLGLGRLKNLDPKPTPQRYVRSRPGELLHLDVKPLARIRRVGHRIHGDRSRSVEGAGWEYAHVAIDDMTRLAFVEVLDDQGGDTTTAFFQRSLAWFAGLGIPVERVLTDNGSGYLSKRFAGACQDAGIRHIRTRPYRPQTNGKAERFIQTLIRGWAYAKPFSNSAYRTQALQPWLRRYNHQRPHRSLGMKPPMAYFQGITEQPT